MDNEYTVSDLVSLSYDQKPIEFQNAFDSLIKDRMADAIADKKLEIAQTVFSGPDDAEDDDDENAEFEDELDF
jgi:hypothetical protein